MSKKILLTLVFMATLVVNYLSVTLPLAGKSVRFLSEKYYNLFTPAPITFSIWSVIYSLLIAYIVWLWVGKKNEDEGMLIDDLGYPTSILLVLNASWLFCWHYEFMALSMVVMLAKLVLLIWINEKIHFKNIARNSTRLLFKATLGIYWAWICVATIANASAFAMSLGIGYDYPIITCIIIFVAAILAAIVLMQRGNYFFAATVLWAIYGIFTRYQRTENYPIIETATIVAMTTVAVSMVSIYFRNRNRGF